VTAGREEALRLEAYLDTATTRLPPPADADALDPDLRRAIDVLRDGLVRFHPSFRFVEELAARLAREAGGLAGQPLLAGEPVLAADAVLVGEGAPLTDTLVPFPLTPLPARAARIDRSIFVRGAISTVSLAGVVLVAWRLGRQSTSTRRLPAIPGLTAPEGRA
jgi:hypothetical protein